MRRGDSRSSSPAAATNRRTCRPMRRDERTLYGEAKDEIEAGSEKGPWARRPSRGVREAGSRREHSGSWWAATDPQDPTDLDRPRAGPDRQAAKQGRQAGPGLPDDAESDRPRARRRVLNLRLESGFAARLLAHAPA